MRGSRRGSGAETAAALHPDVPSPVARSPVQLTSLDSVYLGILAVLTLYGFHRVSLLARFRWPGGGGVEPGAGERGLDGGDALGRAVMWDRTDGDEVALDSSGASGAGASGVSGASDSSDPSDPTEISDSRQPSEPPAGPHPGVEGVVVGGAVPFVTVQLPLFNERNVAARLIRAVGALAWPAERLEIQVLDDSTDDTRDVVDAEVRALRERGIDARVVRREGRAGYKAGALDHGLAIAKGELICIFDADFLPDPDFLVRVAPHFEDAGVGMVQSRWEHVNRDESWLTRAQSTLLDGHFVIEHKVRSDSGLYFNFNGTAGVWRRAAIDGAGGWQVDTLTEDLDLSYRAQLAGWRFVYMSRLGTPAEVPPTISSFQSQQHRWAKGSVQVARKLGLRILRADVPWRVKVEAAAHLTGNVGHPLVFGLAVLLPLSGTFRTPFGSWWHLIVFTACTLSVFVFYDRSQRALGRSALARVRDVPLAIALGIGMCVSQTRAVLEGLVDRTGEFVRTPKRGDGTREYRDLLRGVPGLELVMGGWFAWGLVHAVEQRTWMLLPFLILFFSGFVWVGVLSLQDWMRSLRA